MKDRLVTIGTTVLMLAGLAFLGFLGWQWWQSRLPARYDVMDYGVVDRGGGPPAEHVHFSVADTKVSAAGKPDVRVTLTAEKSRIRLASGKEVDAWTFNGRAPGPEIRVQRGQLLEVTLVNKDIDDGVTIHWHGVDVPNTEDGVAGVTQDAVPPGGRYVYRFRPEQVGTFWYHTHQNASDGVEKGLYGALVIMRETPPEKEEDIAAPVHTFSGRVAIGTNDGLERRAVQAGVPIRLRLIDTDSSPAKFRLSGMKPFVVAIDGAEIAPAPVPAGEAIEIGAGGRYDLWFQQPKGVAAVEVVGSKAGLLFSPDGKGEPVAARSQPVFDPASRARAKPAGLGSHFDRTFQLDDQQEGGLSRRPTRPALGAEREALPTRAHVRGREGRPRAHQPRQRLLRASTRCTCTDTTSSSSRATARRSPPGRPTRSRCSRTSATRSRSERTTPGSGCCTATTSTTRLTG